MTILKAPIFDTRTFVLCVRQGCVCQFCSINGHNEFAWGPEATAGQKLVCEIIRKLCCWPPSHLSSTPPHAIFNNDEEEAKISIIQTWSVGRSSRHFFCAQRYLLRLISGHHVWLLVGKKDVIFNGSYRNPASGEEEISENMISVLFRSCKGVVGFLSEEASKK